MFIHSKLTLRLLRMLMHLSSGHVTLLRGAFQLLNFFPVGFTASGVLTLGSIPNWNFYVLMWVEEIATLVSYGSFTSTKARLPDQITVAPVANSFWLPKAWFQKMPHFLSGSDSGSRLPNIRAKTLSLCIHVVEPV